MHKFAFKMDEGKFPIHRQTGSQFHRTDQHQRSHFTGCAGDRQINPVMIAGLAIGSTIRQMVSNWVAPSANDPWRTEIGMRDKPSSVATITTGSVNTANVRADHSNPGVPKVGVGKRSA